MRITRPTLWIGLISALLAASPAVAIDKAQLIQMKKKVAEAAQYLSEQKEAGLPEFNDRGGKWAREPYIFVWDMQGNCVAHPNNAKMIGKNMIGLTDVKGNKLIMDFIETIRKDGKGWTEYWWNQIGESKPSHKISYIMKVPGTNWLLGAGIYEDASLADVIEIAGK